MYLNQNKHDPTRMLSPQLSRISTCFHIHEQPPCQPILTLILFLHHNSVPNKAPARSAVSRPLRTRVGGRLAVLALIKGREIAWRPCVVSLSLACDLVL